MVHETLRVLVTDDEEGMRLGIERALGNYNATLDDLDATVSFAIDTAASGEEALEKLRTMSFDLQLLDYKLPGLNGLEVLNEIGQTAQTPLTVMITAYASLQTAISATKKGAYDFLAKPFTPDELKATVRKAAHRLLLQRRAAQLAREKQQVRFEFISVLSHELKAPLAAVESYLQLLQQESVPKTEETLERIATRSVHRIQGMRKLIFDLLDLTRIESGNKTRDLRPLDLVALSSDAMELVAGSADTRQIRVELHAPKRLEIEADRSEIEIVFNNLVSNAVKYNRDGGRVDIRLAQSPDGVLVSVADTGIGLTEKERNKLFGEFVRIKNDKTREIEGTGLGLSTTRKIVELYGGSIQVESVPDQGTTFTIHLPITNRVGPAEKKVKENIPGSATD